MSFLYKSIVLAVLSCGFYTTTMAQVATVKGKVTSELLDQIDITIINLNNKERLKVDSTGEYLIQIEPNKKVSLKIIASGYESEFVNVTLQDNEIYERDVVLKTLLESMEGTTITDQSFRGEAGQVRIDVSKAFLNPGPNTGIEGLLKIFTGDNNEMTSQYKVRGGNYDENLVYVNDFEIYRPFLVRTGQQEGLSFINADLTDGVNFSVGGFQSKYGDKMSSVLDVTYKKPKKFGGSAMASLLGAQMHLEGITKNKKFSYLFGARQKSNQYFLQSQPTKGQYNPTFTDIQLLLNYKVSETISMEILGNYARNRFTFQPESSESAFGYFNNVFNLETNFKGNEIDQFDSRFVGYALTFRPNIATRLKIQASAFQTNEKEAYDINGLYDLYAVESDMGKSSFGENKYSLGSGEIHDYARNSLKANVYNLAHKGYYNKNAHALAWGVEAMFFQVTDKMLEWQRRDSAGYSQPFDPNAILMNRFVNANNDLSYQKYSAFIQDNIIMGKDKNVTLNIGSRFTYTTYNKEFLVSPRLQLSWAPVKGNNNIIYRLSTGYYSQPAFYREMRDANGVLNLDVKAQKSYHTAVGFDWNFKMWDDRPFKLTAEVYYKKLWDIIPYEYDNVRIRYAADNNGEGYAYGGEVRLFGNLVKDAESWISVGLLKTENKIFDQNTGEWSDFLARPTDQRATFGMFFSDYLPRNKNFKAFVNMMYSTGLPFSPPGKSLDPSYQLRVKDYKRVDIGFAALLVDGAKKGEYNSNILNKFESIWLSLEIFNLLGIQNVISYQWIQDFNSDRIYAVPNRLTSRLINVKLAVKF